MEEMIWLDIICSNGMMFSIRSNVGSKVIEFKDSLVENSCIPANVQMLIYKGIVLEDLRTLKSYDLKAGHTIYMEVAETETSPPSDTTTGDLGLPALDHPTGGMPDTSLLYPTISQMMQTLLSSTRLIEQIVGQNPQLHSMFDSNPQLRDLIQNHEVVHRLTSPQMMQDPGNEVNELYQKSFEVAANAPASQELPRQNSIRHSNPSEDVAAGPSTSSNAMAPESQKRPRQNSIRHSNPSEDVAAGPSTSSNATAPESQELPRQNSIRHSNPSEDVTAGRSTSSNALNLQPQRSSDVKYQICAGFILGASIVAWKICKS